MSDIKTKQQLSMDLLELVGKYPNHHREMIQLLHVYTGVQLEQSTVGVTSNVAPAPKTAVKQPSKKVEQPPKSGGTLTSGAKTENGPDPKGLVNIPLEKDSEESNFMKCVLLDISKANRQENATKPRMDHKSIGARVSSARKTCRRFLKKYKELMSLEPVEETAPLFKELINSVKHMRIVLSDAFVGKVPSVNIGVDLLSGWMRVEDYHHIHTIVAKRFVEDEITRFWTDPSGPPVPTGGSDDTKNPFGS